jgi:hypothetical protein
MRSLCLDAQAGLQTRTAAVLPACRRPGCDRGAGGNAAEFREYLHAKHLAQPAQSGGRLLTWTVWPPHNLSELCRAISAGRAYIRGEPSKREPP